LGYEILPLRFAQGFSSRAQNVISDFGSESSLSASNAISHYLTFPESIITAINLMLNFLMETKYTERTNLCPNPKTHLLSL
jgi:hypothetical protein